MRVKKMDKHLERIVVRILGRDKGTTGTGFILNAEGLIATCAHVIEAANAEPGSRVELVFHSTGLSSNAFVEPLYWRESDAEDIAILRLESPPQLIDPVPLGSAASAIEHQFITYGYPRAKSKRGMSGQGVVGQLIRDENDVPVVQLGGATEITEGFSGAPVLDRLTDRIIGMVTSVTATDEFGKQSATAFMTPSELLRAVLPSLTLSDICPYRSLESFSEEHERFFFGREQLLDGLLTNLRSEPRFLGVLGPSGSGKSSVVRAGLVPRLRQGKIPGSKRWEILTLTRYETPVPLLEEMGVFGAEHGLVLAVESWRSRHPQRDRLVLVLDQFEELLIAPQSSAARAMLDQLPQLLKSKENISVIIVLRDDFYSRFAAMAPELAQEWLPKRYVQVPQYLSREQVIAIIAHPAQVVGLRFESGLVEAIVDDVLESPGTGEPSGRVARSTMLPLLQFALTRLWEEREDGVLTHSAYDEIGHVTGGLTNWADAAYHHLDEALRPLARRVLTDLVHLGDERQGIPDSRIRRSFSDLCRSSDERQQLDSVIQSLTDARLLTTFGEPPDQGSFVEIIHDALLKEWSTFRSWIDEDRRFLEWRQRIQQQARWWESTAEDIELRDEGRLLHGSDLTEAERRLSEHSHAFTLLERTYILASLDSWRRNQQHLQTLLEESRRHEAEAKRQQTIAIGRQLAAQAEMLKGQHGSMLLRSVLLAMESLSRTSSVDARRVLLSGLAILPVPVHCLFRGRRTTGVAFSMDRRLLAAFGSHFSKSPPALLNTSHIFEVDTGSYIASFTCDSGGLVHEVFDLSPDGRFVAFGCNDQTAYLWHIGQTTKPVQLRHESNPRALRFAPNGRYVASACELGYRESSVHVWNVSGLKIATLESVASVDDLAFSPDGELLAAAGHGGVQVWNTGVWKEDTALRRDGATSPVRFSPDGKFIAAAIFDPVGTCVWRKDAVDETLTFYHDPPRDELDRSTIKDLAFSPDGKFLASGGGGLTMLNIPSGDNSVRIWDLAAHRQTMRVEHEATVNRIRFSPDGSFLASASDDRTARLWEVTTGKEIARMIHEDSLISVEFAREPEHVVTVSRDATARVWDCSRCSNYRPLRHASNVDVIRISPDGRWIATGGADGVVKVWNHRRKQVFQVVHETQAPYPARISSLAFSPDGKLLATASELDNISRIWNAATGEPVAQLPHAEGINFTIFNHDGTLLGTASADCTARLWNSRTGEELVRVTQPNPIEGIAFSPNGDRFATPCHSTYLKSGERDRFARIWDTRTGDLIHELEHQADVKQVGFTPDGKYLVTSGDRDFLARTWEVTSGREIAHMHAPAELHTELIALAISADGTMVAISIAGAGSDDAAWLWAWQTGKISKLQHDGVVRALLFHPSGPYIATGSGDATARVWNVVTGEEMVRVEHDSEVADVTFSPDGKYLATASRDHTSKICLWQDQHLIPETCSRLTRNLSRDEWTRYVGSDEYRSTCEGLSS